MSGTVRFDEPSRSSSLEALSARISDLARFYQLRSRDRVCRHGLTVSQCYALEAIVASGGLSVTELGWQLGVDKSNASRVAETLVDQGLCRFESTPENARIKRVVPRAAGLAKAGRIHAEIREEHQHALESLPAADLLACERVLLALAEARMAARGVRAAGAKVRRQTSRRRA